MSHQENLQVDLKLAHTYIPAIWCTCRASILIIIVANTSVLSNPPMLLCLASFSLMDRIVRTEVIFDSNSVIFTLLASFTADTIRIQYKDTLLLNGPTSKVWGTVAPWFMVILSSCLIMDVKWSQRWPIQGHDIIFILMYMLLLVTVSQTPIGDEIGRAYHDQIMLRSFTFTFVCIIWTYTIGINNMVDLLATSSRMPTYHMTNSKPGKLFYPNQM